MFKSIVLLIFTLAFYSETGFSAEVSSSSSLAENSSGILNPELIWLPVVFYTPETSIAVGVVNIANFWTEKTGKTSNLITTTYLTKNGQSAISLSPKLYFAGATHELFGTFKTSYFPNKFFGRTKISALEDPENYLEKDQLLTVGFGHQFHLDYFVRGSVGYQNKKLSYDPEKSHVRLSEEFQSSSEENEIEFFTLSLDWDDRDFPQSPRSGAWYRVQKTYYHALQTSRPAGLADFSKGELDLRFYAMLNEHNTFATQLYLAAVEGVNIPFTYLLSVGGNQKLRGFYAGRFLGEALALLQFENRTEINSKWAWAQFASLGRIADDVDELQAAENLITAGVGLHYYVDPKNRTKLRLDLGFAQARPGFYFIFAEAF